MRDHLRQVSAGFVETAPLILLVACEVSVAHDGQAMAD